MKEDRLTPEKMKRFLRALPFVLQWEGGYVDDPDDPGGATNKGITQGTYDDWRASCQLDPQPVKFISDCDVSTIYRRRYWEAAHCDELPCDFDIAVFDTAVNMGKRRAIRFLQKAAGCEADGMWGPVTKAAVGSLTNEDLATYLDHRQAKYEQLIRNNPRLAKFRNGWMNRLNALRRRVGVDEG
jgi:lysozyme family protein